MGMKRFRQAFVTAAVIALGGCAAAPSLELDDALATVPYEIDESGLIVVKALVNGRGPYDFALDTGASISFLFEERAAELAIEAVPDTDVIVHGIVATGEFPASRIDRIQVENAVWSDPLLVLLPGKTAATENVDGILGIDFMRRYTIAFSQGESVLRLYRPELVREDAYRGWTAVPLEPATIGRSTERLFFFEVTIDARRIPALFDLGATDNLMNWAAADRIGIVPVGVSAREQLAGALGSTGVVAEFRARGVYTEGVRWGGQEFSIANLEIYRVLNYEDSPLAIIGAGLFNARDFLIDFVRNRLLVKSD